MSSISPCAYAVITDRIIESLEKGVVPWHRPWAGGESPRNLCSGKAYRGINTFLLSASSYASPWWLTFNQAKQRGGHIRKGEQSTPIVFWKWLEVTDKESGEQGKRKRIPFLRYFRVFNAEQCEGIATPAVNPSATTGGFSPIEAAEKIVERMPKAPAIITGEPRAYYRPATDTVNMPARELFSSAQGYYATLFHELTHSTGHKSRLDRPGIAEVAAFGSQTYSREELVAEMGAAYLAGQCGIVQQTIDNAASYIASWLKRLKDDRKLVVIAAAQAQKASDFILGRSFDDADNGTESGE